MKGEVEDLRSRTKKFALRIIRLYSSLSKQTLPQVLGKQLLRSGTSAGANYREGFRSRSKAEFLAKMGDCLKELEETAYWLELFCEGNILEKNRLSPIMNECNQLISIFVTIIKRCRNNS